MSDTYPILLNGREEGTLTVTGRGPMTEFLARCRDPGRLVRLSVYGGGREGYLGVMEPVGGELTLCRRRSRAELKAFPESIEYAAEAGSAPARPAEPRPPEPRRSRREQSGDLLWVQAGDGSLYTVSGGRRYRAFPMANWGLPLERAVDRRTIQGVEYAIFPLEEEKKT